MYEGALMSVDESLLCSFQLLKPANEMKKGIPIGQGRPNTPPQTTSKAVYNT